MIFSILIFVLLLMPFLGALPYMDGSIDFVQIFSFFTGGFPKLFSNMSGVHPPLKVMLGSLFLKTFGVSPLAYNLLGLALGIAALIAIWFLVKKLVNHKVAGISVLLLSSTPLFLASSFFAATDFMLTCLVLISLALYIYNKKVLLTIALCLLVMTKETALLLPVVLLLVESFFALYKWHLKTYNFHWKNFMADFLPAVLPLLLFLGWLEFLKYNNRGVWSEWLFTSSTNTNTFSLILGNIFNLTFLNKYAFQNWNQLLLLNFNWIITGTNIIGTIYYLWHLQDKQKEKIRTSIISANIHLKTITLIVLFCASYYLLVLSLQTWTIPRYGLPVITLALILFATYIYELTKRKLLLKIIVTIILISVTYFALYKSVDPVSKTLWDKGNFIHEEMYNLPDKLAGNDGLFYNLQALKIAKQRSDLIYQANDKGIILHSAQCNWILTKEYIDKQIFTIFKLSKLKPGCKQP